MLCLCRYIHVVGEMGVGGSPHKDMWFDTERGLIVIVHRAGDSTSVSFEV